MNNIKEKNEALKKGWEFWVSRLLTAAIGIVLLVSGLTKAVDIDLFIRQMGDYKIINHYVLLTLSAWGIIITEFILGTALILSYRLRWAIPLSGLLLLIFMGATAWASLTGVTSDCGCFGTLIKRTPGEALLEDLVMLVCLFPEWIRQRHSDKPAKNLKLWGIGAACLAGIVLPLFLGSPLSRISRYLNQSLYIYQRFPDIQDIAQRTLEDGEHLLVIMSTDCPNCQEAAKKFNMWIRNEKTDLPELTVLVPNNEEQIRIFINKYSPEYPVLQITGDQFWKLLEDGDTPRIFLVRYGEIAKIWNGKAPEISNIREALVQ
jgi:uncharacterized membrane protein YphA (DoxX/SURF4 family)